MKTLSLWVFATGFLLSSAFPRNTGINDGHGSLVEGNEGNRKPLEKGKSPGPKLSMENVNPAFFVGIFSKADAMPKKYLPRWEKDRKKDVSLKKSGYKAFRDDAKHREKRVNEEKNRGVQETQREQTRTV